MAEGTAGQAVALERRSPLPLLAGGAVVAGAAVLAFLIGPPSIVLAGCVVAGFGITHLSAIALTLEERLVFGTVLGAMAFSIIAFVMSMLARDVSVLTVLLATSMALAAGVAAVLVHRQELAAEWRDAGERWSASLASARHPWPLLAIFVACSAWTVHFLHQAWTYRPDGLYAGYINIWGDWAAHLTFTGSFAYGHNFPPQMPIDPGNHLGYPFMIDFFAANLVPVGSALPDSLVLSSGLLGLAFPAVLYLCAARFTGGRGAAAVAVALFLLSGGLGFVYLLGAVSAQGLGALVHLPREYTLDRDLNYQWLNPVLAYLVPQRSTLFGFSLALILLVLVWLAVRERHGWPSFLFAGVVAGLTPAFHVHAYGTVMALTAFWFLFNRRREWLAFFVPAIAIGVPVLVWMWPPANNSVCGDAASLQGYCIELGWLSYADWQKDGVLFFGPDFAWFWIKNTSVLIPLILAGHLMNRRTTTRFATWFAPMWLWFLVPSVIVLQPWDWDNTKFFIFFALLGSIVAGAVLADKFQRGGASAVAAALLLLIAVASGALDLARASDYSVSAYQFVDASGVQLADWVREKTPADAVFLVADEHNSPIPTLSGRKVVVGYPGWLLTYGMADYNQKDGDARAMLQGDPSTPQLLRKYGVSYVLIGPQELSPNHGANSNYWALHGNLVYDNGEYRLYFVGDGA